MNEYRNVECGRCGRQWYSPKYDEENKLPENCPYCYQEAVQEIPEPPTRIDIIKEDLIEKKNKAPEKLADKKHRFKIFLENNRMLISMVNVGLIITITIGILAYLLFMQ
ncbi:MAG: NAD-dependent SIR2 family protein deacetylase [Candidatus Nanohaloarchaea archaeon]|jgi:NAD-dependent SIR2 family protein deacetylase